MEQLDRHLITERIHQKHGAALALAVLGIPQKRLYLVVEELALLQGRIWQEAMLLAQCVEGDRPAIGPLAPELAQAIEFHQQPLEGRDLGLQIVVAPLLQQPVGLIHGSSTFDVAGDRLL